MIRCGPRNLITDVPGIALGNAEDLRVRSGVTVVLPDQPAVAAVDVRGGAPGTRETDALGPSCLVEMVHAVVLSGGSAFGLAAADGVMTWLAARGRGFKIVDAIVPIVPSAVLFDLDNGGDKAWGDTPPYRALAQAAAERAGAAFALGIAGAGAGGRAGSFKGGLGSASLAFEGPHGAYTVGAVAAVNCFGSPVIPGTATFWAWTLEQNGEFGGQTPPASPLGAAALDYAFELPEARPRGGAHTTLVAVATDAVLTKSQALRVATMAHDGFARAIRPIHTPLDGDSVFVLATGRQPLADPVGDLGRIGMMAADCVARAITRGVYEAETLGPWRGYRDMRQPRRGTEIRE